MKRLLIASAKLPPLSGGAEQVAWETSKRLVNDYEVHMLTVGNARTNLRENVKIHYAPPLPPYTVLYSSILKPRLQEIYREISPDILHSHILLPWAFVFSRANCAKIVTCHGDDVYPNKRYPARFFVKRALEHADVVIAPSKWLGDYVEEKYNVSCVTLPNGVDTSAFAPMKGVSTSGNVILYVGRPVERKGIRELVEAARALPQYEFWLIGNQKSGTAKVPSLPNIRQLGFADNLAIRYNQASLCVFPSYWENFPIVGLEAMACGKAIVATRLGFSEYVEDGHDGILIEPKRSSELIESIRYLIEDEQARKKLERNAREKALQYDWKPIMDRYRSLYGETL